MPKEKFVKVNALGSFFTGRKILSVIPGLRVEIWKAFALNLVLSVLVCAVALFIGFEFLLNPMESYLIGKLPGWLDWSAVTLKYGLGFLLVVLSLFLAIFIPLNLMFIWYERLVERVVAHIGKPPEGPPIKTSFSHTVFGILREVLIFMGLFAIGFLPIMGPPLVFIFSPHVLGRATFDPYIAGMKERGVHVELKERKFGMTTIALGAMEAGLPIYLPIIGFFLIPWAIIHLVIGLAYIYESERSEVISN